MDIDLESLYEAEHEDDHENEEVYDTPCQTMSSTKETDVQHSSAPALQSLTQSDTNNKSRNSAPDLENDVNLANISNYSYKPYSTNDMNSENIDQNFQNLEEIYMNTSLHADQIFSSQNSSSNYLSESQSSIRKSSVAPKTEIDLHRIREATPSPEQYYMAPPPAPVDFHVSNQNFDIEPKQEEFSPGLYDAPAPIKNNIELPPIPCQLTDPLLIINHTVSDDADSSQNEIQECFYEGISDTELSSLYEGVAPEVEDDNYYEGLENSTDIYEGIDNGDDFYEGISDDAENDVFYEGLEEEPESKSGSIVSLQNLIESLSKSKPEAPYVPPKPPPVPMRNPSKNFKPLPNIPQYKPISHSKTFSIKKSPSFHNLHYKYSPILKDPKHMPKSKSLVDVTSPRSSASPREESSSSMSDDGLYDGIDMGSEEGEVQKEEDIVGDQGDDEMCEKESDPHIRKNKSIKRKVKLTRLKTAAQLEQWKEAISHSFTERKTKWKESKARTEIKTVLKETKTKASEIVHNTETMYAVIQRHASMSRASMRRRGTKRVAKKETEKQAAETSIELEENVEFMSLQPQRQSSHEDQAVAGGSVEGKYYDLEVSGVSDHRSSVTPDSRGRVQSMYSGVSSTMDTSENSEVHQNIESLAMLEDESYSNTAAIGGLLNLAEYEPGAGEPLKLLETVPRPIPCSTTGHMNSHVTYTVTDRHKVLQRILDHEYRYIMSLKDMMKVYAGPFQHSNTHKSLIHPSIAQDIFFRIPEITVHHEFFYEQLRRRSMTWSRHQSMGDILLQLFHKPGLFSAYASYIDNFNHALEIVKDTRAARPAFSKLLDKLRNKSNQLSLEDLIYLPVDHIPVYLELLKELIKQTTQDDPDFTYLHLAKDEIERLIEKLNDRRRQADKSFRVKLLEKKISGLPETLIAPQRYIVREERILELDIMTDRSDERHLVVMSDLLLCLKPLVRSSTSMMSSGLHPEFQFLWQCLITDVDITCKTSDTMVPMLDPPEDTEGYQSLKDDLVILDQIDSLRCQLKGSYSGIRFDKLAEVRERIRRDIAERQSSAESRRGKTLDITRPVNYPCTETQFHRFLFYTSASRSKWQEEFLHRQRLMQHTRGLDWCQVGEDEVMDQAKLSVLLPVMKHMTPIGITTPSQFSVECAAANADFTCPVTRDILSRIMSKDDKLDSYANVEDGIALHPPVPTGDTLDTYDMDLTPGNDGDVSRDHGNVSRDPHNAAAAVDDSIKIRPGLLSPTSRSPFAVTSTTPAESAGGHLTEDPLPLTGYNPVISSLASQKTDRQSIIELIESVPKEFNVDNYDPALVDPEEIYETPIEISLLREEKQKLLRSISADESLLTQGAVLEDTSLEHEIPAQPVSELDELVESLERSIAIPDSIKNLPPDAIVCPLSRFKHMDEFEDESFNLELTESGELSSFIAPKSRQESLGPKKDGSPLLVDKYGQVYTDKITSLISGPGTTLPDGMAVEEEEEEVDESLLELESEDEDDTPNIYDSQLNLTSLVTTDSLHSESLTNTPTSVAVLVSLPQIEVPVSELTPELTPTNSVYENFVSSPQKLRTKVIRRESSKRTMNRSPLVGRSQVSLASDEWQEQDSYENINEETGEFDLKQTDVFLCGHGQDGKGEIVVLRLTEPTPHVSLDIALEGGQVLCCHMVPGRNNTLWVGTQDSRLLVYQMNDPSSSLLALDLPAGGPAISVSHIQDTVFVGTSEGYIHVFHRDDSINQWCENEPLTKQLGTGPVCTMLPINDNMWCSCGSQIFVVSPANATVEHLFSTSNNTSAQVYKMVCSGSGVWLAIRNSPVIRLFHAKTGEHLDDYDISTVVHHLFTGAVNLARRRKSENIRVTALLASSMTGALWVGTSAGVVVVIPVAKPPVTPKVVGPPFLSYMGHYDGVRFLMQAQSRIRKRVESQSTEDVNVYEEITSQVVISCGKGMEDFRDLSTSPDKDKALHNTSYLMIWHYPQSDEH